MSKIDWLLFIFAAIGAIGTVVTLPFWSPKDYDLIVRGDLISQNEANLLIYNNGTKEARNLTVEVPGCRGYSDEGISGVPATYFQDGFHLHPLRPTNPYVIKITKVNCDSSTSLVESTKVTYEDGSERVDWTKSAEMTENLGKSTKWYYYFTIITLLVLAAIFFRRNRQTVSSKKYLTEIDQVIQDWTKLRTECQNSGATRMVRNQGDPFSQPVNMYGMREPLPTEHVLVQELLSRFSDLQTRTTQIISLLDNTYLGFDQYLKQVDAFFHTTRFSSPDEGKKHLTGKIDNQISCLQGVSGVIESETYIVKTKQADQ